MKNQFLYLLLLGILLSVPTFAQKDGVHIPNNIEAKDFSYDQEKNIVTIKYQIEGVAASESVLVEVQFFKNSEEYPISVREKDICGDIGAVKVGDGNKEIKWQLRKEIGRILPSDKIQLRFTYEVIPSNIQLTDALYSAAVPHWGQNKISTNKEKKKFPFKRISYFTYGTYGALVGGSIYLRNRSKKLDDFKKDNPPNTATGKGARDDDIAVMREDIKYAQSIMAAVSIVWTANLSWAMFRGIRKKMKYKRLYDVKDINKCNW